MAKESAYQRVATVLRAQMKEGRYKPGDKLSSEAELVREFEVSRNTVRQALDLLRSMNLVTRQQGRGTFVAQQGLSHVIGELKSFTDLLRERGFTPGMEDLSIALDTDPPLDAIEFFRSSRLWRVDRVRTANGRPFADMRSWVSECVGTNLQQRGMAESGSLYQALRDQCGLLVKEATEVIRAETALPSEATRLEIAACAPLIVMYRWVSDQRGHPTEYVRAASPGDRYQYLAKLRA